MTRIAPPAPCHRCGETVLHTDRHDYYSNVAEPVHRECFIRPIIGSVAHIERRCSCFVPGAEEGDDPTLTRRQAALAAYKAWMKLDLWNRYPMEGDT